MRATRFDPVSFALGKVEGGGGGGTTDYDALSNKPSIGGVTLSGDIPVTLTGDTAITVTNTGTASAIGYSVAHNDSGVTVGNKGDTTNQTPGFGGTFKALSVTVDAKGHVTALGDHTVKVPDAEATQSAKGLMSAADKKKLDTLIDDTLSNAGQAADAKRTGDKITALESENALMRELINGIDAPIYRKASGNPAIFQDGYAANVKALSVTITPTQSGSGDPSPDNIRPISGATSVSVTRRGRNLAYHSGSKTAVSAGITWTLNSDGTVTANGTSTGQSRFYFQPAKFDVETKIYLSSTDTKIRAWTDATGNIGANSNRTLAAGKNSGNIFLYTDSGVTLNNAVCSLVWVVSGADNSVTPAVNDTLSVPLVDSGNNPLTVYGGTLDVTTGELSVQDKMFLLNTSAVSTSEPYLIWRNVPELRECIPQGVNSVISGIDNIGGTLRANTSGDNNIIFITFPDSVSISELVARALDVQILLPLISPVTYQLTPQQLATLSGYNAVSADAGTLSVTYRADPAITLGGG